jgi:hypothetical protein
MIPVHIHQIVGGQHWSLAVIRTHPIVDLREAQAAADAL